MRRLLQLVIISFLITPCQAQKTRLALNLQKGSTYAMNQTSKVSVNESLNGQEMNIVMTVYAKTNFIIKDITNDSYNMEVAYKNMKMEMESPQGTAQYSSTKRDTSDIISTLLANLTNKSFYVQMTKEGKISKVTGLDSLFDEMVKKINVPEAQKKAFKERMTKAYGVNSMKGSIEAVTAIFPDKPVAKNDQWTVHTQLESAMSANLDEVFEYKGDTDSTIQIHGEGKIQTADKDAYIEASGMPLKYDLSGTLNADFTVNKISGWIIEAKINQDVKGTAEIKDNPKMPGGLVIPMTLNGETQISN